MNQIHPTAIVGPRVTFGDENTVGPYAVIVGAVRIGSGNWIGAGVVIGGPPEVRDFPHGRDPLEPGGAGVALGDRNVIREATQIHSGWHAQTRIGDGAFIMNQTYIAHDCVIDDDVTMASGVRIGGHARIGRGANLGLGTTVHQRRVIGGYSMIGMSSVVTADIPPFAKAYGSPCRVHGLNEVGMRRAGFDDDDLEWSRSSTRDPATASAGVRAIVESFESGRS